MPCMAFTRFDSVAHVSTGGFLCGPWVSRTGPRKVGSPDTLPPFPGSSLPPFSQACLFPVRATDPLRSIFGEEGGGAQNHLNLCTVVVLGGITV
jgi:hypothetical protein